MLIPGKSHSRVVSRNSRVSIETLNSARVRTFYQRDRSWITGVGARGGGGRRPVPDTVPGQCGDPIDRSTYRAAVCPKRRKTAVGGGDHGNAMADRPLDGGPGNRRPPRQMPLDNQLTSRDDGRRETACSGRVSGAMAHVSKRRRAARRGGRDRRPALTRRVRETRGPPSDAAGRSADISVVFLVPHATASVCFYRGRLKRPHLHCRADAVE